MSGKLIVLEGMDGAGSEVQSKTLLEFLKEQSIPTERLYYPDYSGPIGNFIHDYLHSKHELPAISQFLMFAADIAKDKKKIEQWLKEDKWVICDRYFTSTLAYQCPEALTLDSALKIAEQLGIRKPDIVFFLKISPETSFERKKKEKGDDIDRNEGDVELQQRMLVRYNGLASDNVFGRWVVLDGEKPIEGVFEEIKSALGFQ